MKEFKLDSMCKNPIMISKRTSGISWIKKDYYGDKIHTLYNSVICKFIYLVLFL